MTLRGLWIVPLLETRHGFTLVESGNVVFAASLAAPVAAPHARRRA